MNNTYQHYIYPDHALTPRQTWRARNEPRYVPLALAQPVYVPAPPPPAPAFFRTKKVGGLRFFWCGRLVVSYCIKKRT